MSGMHQPVSQDQSIGNLANDPILHAIDFEDVALSREAQSSYTMAHVLSCGSSCPRPTVTI